MAEETGAAFEGTISYCWQESRGCEFSHMAAWRLRIGRFMKAGLGISRAANGT